MTLLLRHRLLFIHILVIFLGSLAEYTDAAAACQACLFSIPLIATRGHHHKFRHRGPYGPLKTPSVVGVRAHLASALLPFGVVATRYVAGPRYKSWLLRVGDDIPFQLRLHKY